MLRRAPLAISLSHGRPAGLQLTMIPVRTRRDMQQSRGLQKMHPMPFPLWNDARISRTQLQRSIWRGVDGDGHPPGENINELIPVRMPLTGVGWITRHVRDTDAESICAQGRTSTVRNRRHSQIATDRYGVPRRVNTLNRAHSLLRPR